jgi:hypothetical protein
MEVLSRFIHRQFLWLELRSYALAAVLPAAGLRIRETDRLNVVFARLRSDETINHVGRPTAVVGRWLNEPNFLEGP